MQARADRVISWVLKPRIHLVEAERFGENDRDIKKTPSGGNGPEGGGVVARDIGRTDEPERSLSALWRAPKEWL